MGDAAIAAGQTRCHTYEDFKRSLLNENYFYFRLLSKGVAAPLACGMYRLGVTANQMTFFAILMLLPAVLLNLAGHFYAAIVFFHLFFVIDATDGVLARGSDAKSRKGAYLDDMAHYLFHTPYMLSFAYALSTRGDAVSSLAMIIFISVNNLQRAEQDVARRTLRSRGGADGERILGPATTLPGKVKSFILGSFDFPNVLVWMTLLCWNMQYLRAYFVYAAAMSTLYLMYTFARVVTTRERAYGEGR